MNVLVVEDSEDLAEAMAMVLGDAGHAVTLSSPETGQSVEAFAASILAAHPDVLLLDLGLGELDGAAVLDALAAHEAAPPIVLCTGADRGRVAAHRSKVVRVLAKPFSFEDLLDAVASIGRPR